MKKYVTDWKKYLQNEYHEAFIEALAGLDRVYTFKIRKRKGIEGQRNEEIFYEIKDDCYISGHGHIDLHYIQDYFKELGWETVYDPGNIKSRATLQIIGKVNKVQAFRDYENISLQSPLLE